MGEGSKSPTVCLLSQKALHVTDTECWSCQDPAIPAIDTVCLPSRPRQQRCILSSKLDASSSLLCVCSRPCLQDSQATVAGVEA